MNLINKSNAKIRYKQLLNLLSLLCTYCVIIDD